VQLDQLDLDLLNLLLEEPRAGMREYARVLGVARGTVQARLNRLEREGYIEGYRAMLRRDQIGLGLTVFVGVKIAGHANEMATGFEQAVVGLPEVVACHMISGDTDYLLEVVVPDLDCYRRFLIGKLLELAVVHEVRSNIAIETLKAGGSLPLDHLETR